MLVQTAERDMKANVTNLRGIPYIQQQGHLSICRLSTNALDLSTLPFQKKTVSKTARQFQGAAGEGRTDLEKIASWVLKFGTYIQRLWYAIARLAKWLSNDNPPWAAYRAWMADRLKAFDENQGVHHITIGEVL